MNAVVYSHVFFNASVFWGFEGVVPAINKHEIKHATCEISLYISYKIMAITVVFLICN